MQTLSYLGLVASNALAAHLVNTPGTYLMAALNIGMLTAVMVVISNMPRPQRVRPRAYPTHEGLRAW